MTNLAYMSIANNKPTHKPNAHPPRHICGFVSYNFKLINTDMKKAHKIGSVILAGIGLLHIIFGILFAKEFNSEIIWFESFGLFLILIGLINLILISNILQRPFLLATQIFNWICVLTLVLVVFAEPMGIGILALAIQIGNSLLSWKDIKVKIDCCSKYRLQKDYS